MCGINGIVRLEPGAPPLDVEEASRTRDAMATRGPDGAGLWLSPTGDAVLGHRRLAVIDLSEAAAQPMVSADGRYVIAYNGELYNYRELRSELVREGMAFRTSSDTEVLLALYARFGAGMLGRLRGMFAFAVWDERERSLFLARDPFGIKPLYYARRQGAFRFASQVRALEAGRAVPRDLDPGGVVGFLVWGSVPEPLTLLRAVRALPAGHWMEVGAGASGIPVPYGSLPEPVPEEDASQALTDSVRAHLVADVPVGVFLSAGLDSSVLLASAVRQLGHAPLSFTLTFEEFRGTDLDEGPAAAAIAKRFGSRHVEHRVPPGLLEELWPEALDAMDQPSIDGFNVFVVSRFAHEAGLKVALSGLGGDEVFGGYPSFRDVPRWRRWSRLASRVPALSSVWPRFAQQVAGNRPKLAGALRHGRTWGGAYFLRRGLFLPEELGDILDTDFAAEGLSTYDPVIEARKVAGDEAVDGWLAVQRLESALYLKNQLLRDADWASMAHSLELRVPFVDCRLYSALACRDFEPARSRGKAVLARMTVPELPQESLARAKSGFMMPPALTEGVAFDRGFAWGQRSRTRALGILAEFGVEVRAAAKIARRPRA
jgi:asparagine synthase (glutamine-hydrolysing)